MATQSIMKNVMICDRESAEKLVDTLEATQENIRDDVVLSKYCANVKQQDIKKLFA